MKIGIFTETYHPTINGVVVSVDTFKQELEKKGHRYLIVAPDNQLKKKDAANVFRIPSFTIPGNPVYPLAKPGFLSTILAKLPVKAIKELDIIHIQHYVLSGQYGLNLARELDIPSVYTYHTMAELYADNFPIIGNFIKGPIRWLTRYTSQRASRVVAPTPSIKKYLHSIGVTQPIDVVPTGIDTSQYKRVNPEYAKLKYRIPTDHKLLLYVGRLAQEKNIYLMLESLKIVIAKNPKVHLLVVGGGPDMKEFERWVKNNNLAGNVTFTGFLPRPETIKLFGTADLFIFPSITDTQGIVIIEALAAGAVPVAADRLGPHDIIEDGVTGRLSGLKPQQFSGIILELLADDALRSKLSKQAMLAAKQYDKKETAKLMENVYRKAIAQG